MGLCSSSGPLHNAAGEDNRLPLPSCSWGHPGLCWLRRGKLGEFPSDQGGGCYGLARSQVFGSGEKGEEGKEWEGGERREGEKEKGGF